MVRASLVILLAWLTVAAAGGAHASAVAAELTPQQMFFAMKVRPLLNEKCLACHGEDREKIKGEFDMTTRAGLLKGGESGHASLIPGDAAKSPLLIAVTWENEDLQMPPKENDRLTAEQVEIIRKWIAEGGHWFDGDVPQPQVEQWNQQHAGGVAIKTSGGLSADWTQRRYDPGSIWAFAPVRVVQPPVGGAVHPIDAFINAKLDEKGLEPAARADKLTLIRRVTYDLTGLPPTPPEIESFLRDTSPHAYENLVDRLLASPHYGEQWAKHWLDVVRYADTSGYSNDHARPTAWRYRDYVIRAFNSDKPFNEFIIEQIAGDELNPDDPEMLVAAGFLRMGPWEHTGMAVAAVTRQEFLDDVTNAVGVTFLGQGMACAKCHDHKFDPIPTRDYYRLQAVFAPTQFAERDAAFLPVEQSTLGDIAAEKARLEQLLKETKQARAVIDLKQRKAQQAMLKARGVELELSEINAWLRKNKADDDQEIRHAGLSYQELGVRKVLNKRVEYLERQLVRFEPMAFSVYNGPERVYNSNKSFMEMPGPAQRDGPLETVHILTGGSLESPADPVTPGVLSAAVELAAASAGESRGEIPDTADGRRLALANWIASPHNPLTARVIVNRIWQQHFAGKGIVATPNNFGVMGAKPTHPELLDWMATWFIDHGWSIKKLHKLIVTSEAYQRSGHPRPRNERVAEIDPGNDLLAYYPPRRLTAEEIRDSMLAVTGELNPQMGGPAVFPEINMEVALQPQHVMGSTAPAYQPSPLPSQRHRRTIYAYLYRNRSNPMLEVFNKPGSEASCERRDQTTVTPQVFALLNGQESLDRALAMALRLETLHDDPRQRIEAAFRLVYGRPPGGAEMDAAMSHVSVMTEHHRANQPRKIEYPTVVHREMVEEMTGVAFTWDEELDIFARGTFVPDAKPWDVEPRTRALAELCLVLLNSNEFLYVY